jgi:formate dehydrogenase major subunit
MQVTRRQFFKVCAGGLGSSSLAMLGFMPGEALAEVREFKLTRSTETRNTCPYCSVSCGLLMYSYGDDEERQDRHLPSRRSRSSGESRHGG